MWKDTISRIKRYLMPLFSALGNERGEVGVDDKTVDWKTTLIPAEIQKDPIFEKYQTPQEVMKAVVEAQKFLGREKLPVPKDANDKETYDLIFKKLGFPETDAGYELATDLNIPKELPFDENMLNGFKKLSHENRLLPSQVKAIHKWYMTNTIEAYNKFGEERKVLQEKSETELRQKWGAGYAQNVALAQKVFKNFADEKTYAEIEKGLGNNPILIELFANIGKVLSEDQLIGKPQNLSMTPDEINAEIKKMESDPKSPLRDASHPEHLEWVEKRNRFYKMLE